MGITKKINKNRYILPLRIVNNSLTTTNTIDPIKITTTIPSNHLRFFGNNFLRDIIHPEPIELQEPHQQLRRPQIPIIPLPIPLNRPPQLLILYKRDDHQEQRVTAEPAVVWRE